MGTLRFRGPRGPWIKIPRGSIGTNIKAKVTEIVLIMLKMRLRLLWIEKLFVLLNKIQKFIIYR